MSFFSDHILGSIRKRLGAAHADPQCVDVAVIIISHNYGSMLRRAIDSILRQTVQPAEILIIDDASTDTTRAIAETYAESGVSYMRVEHNNLSLTRNSAARATSSPFLLYLDADDFLPPHYIKRCLEHMADPAVGIVYGEVQQFGSHTALLGIPAFDAYSITKQNYITSNALLRREMFDMAGGYQQLPHSFEDWDFIRRCMAFGYVCRRADTWTHYNLHPDSLSARHAAGPHKSYMNDAALLHRPVTVFTPFFGNGATFEHYLAGLLSTDCNPAMIHLWWYNTSSDPSYERMLRAAAAQLPFGSVRYMHAPLPETWRMESSMNAAYRQQLGALRAYNTLLQECSTEYILTLEEDTALRASTLRNLFAAMNEQTAAVIAPCFNHATGHYDIWQGGKAGNILRIQQKGEGVQEVIGDSFGCVLFRTAALKRIAPLHTGITQEPQQGYALVSFLRLQEEGRVLCHWEQETGHSRS